MKRAHWMVAMVLTGLAVSCANAAPGAAAKGEIDELIANVANSGCEFNRNGTWYDAPRAAAHIKSKYDAMASKNVIESAEDFIERAASRSSMSGADYLMRCQGAAPVTSGRWLRERLDASRAAKRAEWASSDARARAPR